MGISTKIKRAKKSETRRERKILPEEIKDKEDKSNIDKEKNYKQEDLHTSYILMTNYDVPTYVYQNNSKTIISDFKINTVNIIINSFSQYT